VLAVQNPNALTRDAQPFGQKRDHGLVRSPFDRGSGQPYEHSSAAHARYLVPFRSRDDADVDLDARRRVADQDRNSDRELERGLRD
jgi:hypothetical protein